VADEAAARQVKRDTMEVGTDLGLARESKRSGEGGREAEAPARNLIAAAADTRQTPAHRVLAPLGKAGWNSEWLGLSQVGPLG
jgi:hypothetical protein